MFHNVYWTLHIENWAQNTTLCVQNPPDWSILVEIGPDWSILVQIGPYWSRLVQIVPDWSRLVWLAHICPDWSKWYYIWLAFYFVEDITNDYNHNSMQIIDWSILVQIGPLFQSQHWYISQRPGSCLLPSFLLCWPTPLDVNMAQQKIISFLQLPMSYVWTQIQIFILVNFTPPAYWWTMSFKVSVLYSYFRWELGGISLIQAVGYIWDRANINKLHFRLFW